jgi:hypothetical protein
MKLKYLEAKLKYLERKNIMMLSGGAERRQQEELLKAMAERGSLRAAAEAAAAYGGPRAAAASGYYSQEEERRRAERGSLRAAAAYGGPRAAAASGYYSQEEERRRAERGSLRAEARQEQKGTQILDDIPANCWKRIGGYEDIVKYNILLKDSIDREEKIGTTTRRIELFNSEQYPEFLFMVSTDYDMKPSSKTFGSGHLGAKYLYRKIETDLKGEIEYMLQNKKDSFYTTENLLMLFNNGLQGECS